MSDVYEEGVDLAVQLEKRLFAEVPINFEDVKQMRGVQSKLPTRRIPAMDEAVMHIEAVAHRLRNKARVGRNSDYDDLLRLLDQVQAWERRVSDGGELEGEL